MGEMTAIYWLDRGCLQNTNWAIACLCL